MSQSLSKIVVHVVFSTKNRRPLLADPDIRCSLYKYLGGILRELKCSSIEIGGASDHVHIVCSLAKTHALSDVIQNLKTSSSKWLKENGVRGFAWQNGYRAFSVSESNLEEVRRYVVSQEEHHRKMTFQDELRRLLQRHKVEFDERYLWD